MTKSLDDEPVLRYVNNLTPKQIKKHAKTLSELRKNGVYKNIMKRRKWYMTELDVIEYPYLKVCDINENVKPLLNRFENDLSDIFASSVYPAHDNPLLVHPEFKSQGKITEKNLIALKDGFRYRIIDGSHRAIRMALDGEHKFRVIYAEEYTWFQKVIRWFGKMLK